MKERQELAAKARERLRLATEHHAQGRFDEAEACYREVLRAEPDNADALHFLGVLAAQRGNYAQAATLIGRAVVLNPANAHAQYNLGNALRDGRRREDALVSYDRALALSPAFAQAWSNRGAVLEELGRAQQALDSIDRALALQPGDLTALYNRGNALRALGRTDEALAMYDRVLAAAPGHANAFNAKGSVLQDLGRYEDAFAAYDRVYSLAPEFPFAEGWRLHAKMQVCDWSNLAEERARLDAHIEKGIPASAPFVPLASSSSPAVQLRCTQAFTAERYPADPEPVWKGEIYRHPKIRIGYVSGEFHEQATAYLTADLYECHDRSDFELYAVSIGREDASPMRKRLEKSFDAFWNLSGSSDRAVAERIHKAEIDILVDLNGYFGHERTGIFAHRPCPVQVNYLGFPGTMGASYIDYIVADRTIIPDAMREYFSEKIAYLPETYQPNDRKRPRPNSTKSRADFGLPETGLVFCCFNNPHKLTPEMFDIWMRLLCAADGSVLWLMESNVSMRRNLLREASARGVPAERLVFAPLLKQADHLARLGLADLVLDTLPHNAHTTASDALWCGVPVLTCRGTTFAARVAASLVDAAGLPDLVTVSLADYEALALRLANEPGLLTNQRSQLLRGRETCPLFDTPRYTRHLESAYRTMWERQRRGLAPASFAVERLP